MKALREIKKIKNNKVVLTIPHGFAKNEVEILILPHESKKKYDFKDLSGKLEWHGDAVKQQREQRNEWE